MELETSNAERLRAWLMGCPAIDPTKRFGLDDLGESPPQYALMTVPSALKWRGNILGQQVAAPEQVERFFFASREFWGSDAVQGLESLRFYRAVTDWIAAQNAAGAFPAWAGGVVTGIVPTLTASPVDYGAGTARYEIQIDVNYRTV